MAQQTAVNWVISVVDNLIPSADLESVRKLLEQAKEMEKDQIIDANIAGMEFIPVDPNKYQQDAEQYYNETYNI